MLRILAPMGRWFFAFVVLVLAGGLYGAHAVDVAAYLDPGSVSFSSGGAGSRLKKLPAVRDAIQAYAAAQGSASRPVPPRADIVVPAHHHRAELWVQTAAALRDGTLETGQTGGWTLELSGDDAATIETEAKHTARRGISTFEMSGICLNAASQTNGKRRPG